MKSCHILTVLLLTLPFASCQQEKKTTDQGSVVMQKAEAERQRQLQQLENSVTASPALLETDTSSLDKDKLDEVARTARRISSAQLERLLGAFTQGASQEWLPFLRDVSISPGPYETKEDIMRKEQAALASANDRLRKYYASWEPKTVTVFFKRVGAVRGPRKGHWTYGWYSKPNQFYAEYDPDARCARVDPPNIILPVGRAEYAPESYYVAGSNKGCKVWCNAGPYFKYSHGKVASNKSLPAQLSSEIIAVNLPLKAAKTLDISNSEECFEYTFRFGSTEIPYRVNGFHPVEFPCLQLLSARWIIRTDTLWYCGMGQTSDIEDSIYGRAEFTLWGKN